MTRVVVGGGIEVSASYPPPSATSPALPGRAATPQLGAIVNTAVLVDAVRVELGDDADLTAANDFRPRARGEIAAVAVGVVIGALGVLGATVILALSDDISYAPLVGAAAIAVWTAGATGGVAALVTGWGLAAWALAPPRFAFDIGTRDEFVRWAASLIVGVVVTGVGIAMRRGHSRAADAVERAERSRLRVLGLQGLSASLSAALTPEEVARALVDGVPATIGARGGAFGLLDGDDLVIVDPAGSARQTLQPGSRMSLSTRAPITTAAREGAPAWVQRRREFVSRFPEGAALAPYASGALAVPVLVGDRLVGAMGFPFAEPDAITGEVRTVAQVAADLGGQALERAELYAQERASREALDRILAVAPRFLRGATSEAVITSVCAEARRTFGCDVAQVWTPLDGDKEIEVAWRDPPSSVIPPGTRIAYADLPGVIEAMHALRSMFVENAQTHARGEALRHARELGIFSSLRIPIVIGAQFDRVLVLQWERVIAEPAPSVLAVARRFADQAGLAIEQAERRTRAGTDPGAPGGHRSARRRNHARRRRDGNRPPGRCSARRSRRHGVRAQRGRRIRRADRKRGVCRRGGSGMVDDRTRCRVSCDRRDPYPGDDRLRIARRDRQSLSLVRCDGGLVRGSPAGCGGSSHRCRLHRLARHVARTRLRDASVVVSLARQAAQALDRAQLFQREQASANRLRKLQLVTAALSKAVTAADVSQTCLEFAAAGVEASEALVVLPHERFDDLRVVAAVGLGSIER